MVKRSEIILGYETDQASIKQAIAESKKVGSAIADATSIEVEKAVRTSAVSVNEAYDAVNKNVALAGDVASNAAQVGGALRALGADFAGDALEGLVVLGDFTEGLPRLKSAIAGLPQAFNTVISTIGVGGFGLIGAVGLGVVAFSELSKSLDEARKQGEEYAQSLVDIASDIATAQNALSKGNATDAIQQLIDAQEEQTVLTLKQARLQEELATLEAQRLQRSSGQLGVLDQLADRFDPIVQQIDGSISVLKDSLAETSGEITESARTVNELVGVLNDYGFTNEEIINEMALLNTTTEQATEAVTALNTALLAQADSTRNRYLEEISLLDQTDEALKDRQKALADEMIANQRAIDVLKASGDTSDEVTKQIEKYAQANAELGKTLDFISNTALPNATARAQAEATRADTEQTQKDIIGATKKYNDTLETITTDGQKAMMDIEKKRTEDLLSITKKYADDTANALTALNDGLAKAQDDFTSNELKARQTALNAELDATRAHYDSLEDISVGAKRDEQDALRNLDFKGAFDARRNANRAIADEQKKFTRDARDRVVNLDRERKDRLDAYERAQSDLRANYQRELQLAKQNQERSLAEARASYQKEQAEARNAQALKLRDLQTGYAQEIALARQTSAQRIAIEAQTNAQLLAQAQSILASLSSYRPAGSGFRASPTTPNRPNPSQPPNTGNRGGGGNRNQTIVINGANNPRRVAEQIQNIAGRGNNGGARR